VELTATDDGGGRFAYEIPEPVDNATEESSDEALGGICGIVPNEEAGAAKFDAELEAEERALFLMTACGKKSSARTVKRSTGVTFCLPRGWKSK
jgi:hypothetical protein